MQRDHLFVSSKIPCTANDFKNPNIAFSVAWFNPKTHRPKRNSRIGVPRSKNAKEIILGLTLFAQSFPDLGKNYTEMDSQNA